MNSSDSPSSARPAGIDPRGPRFAASVTTVLLLVGVFLALVGTAVRGQTSLAERIGDPAFILLLVVDLLFVWGFAAPRTAPWGALYRVAIRPRLQPPVDLEDPRPPRFAQVIGFVVVTVGLVLHVAGVAWALPIAAALAFIAAFLNAAFGVCLGCLLYLALARAGVFRPRGGLLGA
ncbi:hypothetical protein RM52_04505 [Microbacterium hominis]|uniref:DUF4395 domain-containing protein n=1 Tax=Microbacterium hominis TaxID=162426 RepID=A0A0B4CD49_9MICO|nr:hypothetical protein RM52_04505 [Microbacterium hominis]